MSELFAEMLTVGGKSNSLGRVNEVIEIVLKDKSRLGELYSCLFDEDAWVRMRAADGLEKVCRVHPEWFEPYVDKFQNDLATNTQPSIQWHLIQMYQQVKLTNQQRKFVIDWLKKLLKTKEVDWIVANYAMEFLVSFVKDGLIPKSETVTLLKVQQKHKSKTVVKRANKLLSGLLPSNL